MTRTHKKHTTVDRKCEYCANSKLLKDKLWKDERAKQDLRDDVR